VKTIDILAVAVKAVSVICGCTNVALAIVFNVVLAFRHSLLPGMDEGMAWWFRYLTTGGVVFGIGLVCACLSRRPRRQQFLLNSSFPIGVALFIAQVYLFSPPQKTIIGRPDEPGSGSNGSHTLSKVPEISKK
jgi:hypothetical protein